MKLISHRGNLRGPNPIKENTKDYIETAIHKGFDVEIDIRAELTNSTDPTSYKYTLGHDYSQEATPYQWLLQFKDKLWIHCKNLEALYAFRNTDFHYFWHQEDDFTLTSQKIIWTYPLKRVTSNSVIVCWDESSAIDYMNSNAMGICCDYVSNIMEIK